MSRIRCNMAQHAGRSLISCPEAYSESLNSFYASLDPGKGNITINCLEEHVVPSISDVLQDPEDDSPFCILSVGSAEGNNDLSFIEMLSKARRGQAVNPQFFERAIEPDKTKLESFRAKAEDLPESLKSKADIKFEWFAMTYQEYVEQKKGNDVKFDVVHFLHSIYYVGTGLEAALKHCYENELGPKGVIFSITQHFNSPYVKYGKAFSSQGLILSPGSYYSNKEVTDVAKKNGWKYMECQGESVSCDITAIFDRSSVEGNLLLDFLTQWENISLTVGEENLQKILTFWENESIAISHGRKLVNFETRTVMILKGMQ